MRVQEVEGSTAEAMFQQAKGTGPHAQVEHWFPLGASTVIRGGSRGDREPGQGSVEMGGYNVGTCSLPFLIALLSPRIRKQGQQLRTRMERETLGHELVVQGSEWTGNVM